MKGMRAPTSCRVGETTVTVKGANYPTLAIFFSGEHGRGEAGHYHFWTAVLYERRKLEGRIRWRSIARAQSVHSPGERFERMGVEARTDMLPCDREHNRKLWDDVLERGRNISYIRPSTLAEVKRWCGPHKSDARYIKTLIVGGRVMTPDLLLTTLEPA